MKIEAKPGVAFDRPSAERDRLITTLLLLEREEGWPITITITSGSDGQHSPGSQHPKGTAIDIRSHSFSDFSRERFRAAYEAKLGPQFRVLHEYIGTPQEHFHAQVRKGHTFDPLAP